MMQAMNTGHDGSMPTVHANTARDAWPRIENMMLMGNANLSMRAMRGQMASAIDVVVPTARMRDGVRRVTEMVELAGLEVEVFSLNPLFTFKFEGENLDGKLMGAFEPSNLRRRFLSRLDYFGLAHAFMATMTR